MLKFSAFMIYIFTGEQLISNLNGTKIVMKRGIALLPPSFHQQPRPQPLQASGLHHSKRVLYSRRGEDSSLSRGNFFLFLNYLRRAVHLQGNRAAHPSPPPRSRGAPSSALHPPGSPQHLQEPGPRRGWWGFGIRTQWVTFSQFIAPVAHPTSGSAQVPLVRDAHGPLGACHPNSTLPW